MSTQAIPASPADEEGASGLYVYGVTSSQATVGPDSGIGVGGRPLATIAVGDLSAVVSEIDAAEFTAESLSGGDGDRTQAERVERQVRAHDSVLRAVAAQGPLVPLRFATVLRTPADVRSLLERHGRQLSRTLERVRGTAEWGVKGWLDIEMLREHAAQVGQQTRELDAGSPPAGGGAAYLLGKRRAKAVDKDADRLRDEIVAACHEHLAGLARDSTVLALRAGTDSDEQLALNASYLVDDGLAGAFASAVEELTRHHQPAGLRLERTGPWPPYSFVGDALTGPEQ